MADDSLLLTTEPANKSYNVTASDSVDLKPYARSIHVGTQGNMAIMNLDGSTAIFYAAIGEIHCRAKRIMASGTSASGFTVMS